MQGILAVVIVYNPDEHLLIKNISSFIGHVQRVWVWQNSPIPSSLKQHLQRIPNAEKLEIVGSGQKNIGISKALNEAYHFAKQEGFRHLLTMDQDSIWVDFPKFIDYVDKYILQGDQLALCGPTLDQGASKAFHEEVHYLITSGTLVPIQLLDSIGGYCEDFMVDGIDFASTSV